MAKLRNNIWTLYGMLVIISSVLFGVFGHNTYQSTLKKFQDNQLIQIELFTSSVDSLFKSQESLLEVIGNQLVKEIDLSQRDFSESDISRAAPILDKLMAIHPAIAGFGLTTIDGEFVAVTSNVDKQKLPNLLHQSESRDGFMMALLSDRMVLGRTYDMPALGSLIIPLRKAIRDENGDVLAVMTAGLKLNSTLVFRNNVHSGPHNIISLVNDDLHRLFVSTDDISPDFAYYKYPVDQSLYQEVIDTVERQHHLNEYELKSQTGATSILLDFVDEQSLLTLKYLQDYQVWTSSLTGLKHIHSVFIKSILQYLLVFAVIQLAFFYLVRSVAKNEAITRARLMHQATHDSLTSMPNREYLRAHISTWLRDENEPFALFFIDIDNFKSVNDTHGHDFGDQVLTQISHRLRLFDDHKRLLVRESSDEFILLVKEDNTVQLRQLAQNIIDQLSTPYMVNQIQFLLSCSIGISVFPTHGRDLDDLMRAADISMYQAKLERNAFNLFSEEMQANHLHRMRVEQRLRHAISNQDLFMVYQPQLTMNGELHGVEALIRWKDEELGFVPPNEFIPIAETSGMMTKLGQFIIERSVEDIAQFCRQSEVDLQLSLNVSVKQFMQPNFIEHLIGTIEKHHFRRDKVTLEITENLFIEDLDKFKPICNQLHDMGLKISLDDFGTGYSSLSMLKALPIDELKIDKSFIDSIESDLKSYNMVQNIIAIGKNFGMAVLAEGVETTAQKQKLSLSQVDLVQGYYFSKPLSKQHLELYIEALRHTRAPRKPMLATTEA